jgi:hypothetical protein
MDKKNMSNTSKLWCVICECAAQTFQFFGSNDTRCGICYTPMNIHHPQHNTALDIKKASGLASNRFELADKLKSEWIKEYEKEGLSKEAEAASVPDLLRSAASTYEERNKLYGDNYKRFGDVMLALLPAGVKLETKEQWNRFGVFFHVVGKVTRYAANIDAGGHTDSAHDLSVYAAMLEELTEGES